MVRALREWTEKYPLPMKENLKTDKLSYILKQIQDWPLTTGLSDMELASLPRIYIAFHNMVVVGDLEKEFGNREFYCQRIEGLYALCNERLNDLQSSLEKRIPLIYTLYQLLLNPTLCTVDREKQQRCDTLAYETVMDYLQEVSVGRLTERPKMEFEMCRLIAELCCNLDEEEREEEEMMFYFRKKLTTWVDSLVNGNHWSGVSNLAAMQRLFILCRNSDMFLDTTYDSEIRRVREYYSKQVLFTDKNDISAYQTIALFYEINLGVCAVQEAPVFIQRFAGLIQLGGYTFPPKSEEQLFCLAWAAEGMCRQHLTCCYNLL